MIIHQLRRLLCRTRKPVKVINVLGNVRSCHKADSLRSMMSAVSEERSSCTLYSTLIFCSFTIYHEDISAQRNGLSSSQESLGLNRKNTTLDPAFLAVREMEIVMHHLHTVEI